MTSPRLIVLGVDPGLRSTGLALAVDAGPGMPALLASATARVDAGEARADRMLDEVARACAALVDTAGTAPIALVALEAFTHRGWLATPAGVPRRVSTAPEMGRLVGRLVERLPRLPGRPQVVEVVPQETKRGYPSNAKVLARLLPAGLANRHERDAFLAASWALSLERIHRAAPPSRLRGAAPLTL